LPLLSSFFISTFNFLKKMQMSPLIFAMLVLYAITDSRSRLIDPYNA